MLATEIDLDDSSVEEISNLNIELITLKNLIKEMDETMGAYAFNKIFNKLKEAQYNYDAWFLEQQIKHNISVTEENRWNVDFIQKKLQLLKG